MTSTDRAFITVFRREAKPPLTDATSAAATTTPRLPGAGVEVVSFATPKRARQTDDEPETPMQDSAIRERSTGLPSSQPKHILHAPHSNVVGLRSGRRPLSAFAREREERDGGEEFRPATVLERLRWPAVCLQLAAEHSGQLACVLEAVGRIPPDGTKILGIAGTAPGGGCTTFALALARQAARLGRRVLIVETDADAPCLRGQLELAAEHGLSDLLMGRIDLNEATTYAHDDRVAVIPWGQAAMRTIDGRQKLLLSLTGGRLRFAFDLVLVDLGTPTTASRVALEAFSALHGDATLVVTSAGGPADRLTFVRSQLESTGRPVLGIIENGAAADQHR